MTLGLTDCRILHLFFNLLICQFSYLENKGVFYLLGIMIAMEVKLSNTLEFFLEEYNVPLDSESYETLIPSNLPHLPLLSLKKFTVASLVFSGLQ